MFYVIHSELLKFSVEMEFLEFSSKEAAAPLMSVVGLIKVLEILGKKSKFWIFFENFEKLYRILKITSSR